MSGEIEELYAFIADPKGNKDECLVCDSIDCNDMVKKLTRAVLKVPLIYNPVEVDSPKGYNLLLKKKTAKEIAQRTGIPIFLIRFTKCEVIEVINPWGG